MAPNPAKRKPHPDQPRSGSGQPPKDSPAGRRPLTDDERIDEAVEESFGTSDPPGYGGPTRVGAPPKRKQKPQKKPT